MQGEMRMRKNRRAGAADLQDFCFGSISNFFSEPSTFQMSGNNMRSMTSSACCMHYIIWATSTSDWLFISLKYCLGDFCIASSQVLYIIRGLVDKRIAPQLVGHRIQSCWQGHQSCSPWGIICMFSGFLSNWSFHFLGAIFLQGEADYCIFPGKF